MELEWNTETKCALVSPKKTLKTYDVMFVRKDEKLTRWENGSTVDERFSPHHHSNIHQEPKLITIPTTTFAAA